MFMGLLKAFLEKGSLFLFSNQNVGFSLDTCCLLYLNDMCFSLVWVLISVLRALNTVLFSSAVSVNVGGKQYLLGLYDTAGQVKFAITMTELLLCL